MEYRGYLIEAFEEWPRRWFANVRRLDDQAIPGTQSTSLRTFSVRPSKAAAIEFAKKVIAPRLGRRNLKLGIAPTSASASRPLPSSVAFSVFR